MLNKYKPTFFLKEIYNRNMLSGKNILIILLLILLSGIPIGLNTYRTNSIETIPKEDPVSQKALDKVITLSKYDPALGIEGLLKLQELPKYTAYKRDYVLARLYQKSGNAEEANIIFKKLLENNYPLKERVIFHYAFLNTKLGNDKEALKYFNKLLKEFPNSVSVPQTKYYLAQALIRLQKKGSALSVFKRLNDDYPDTQYGIASNFYLGEDAYYKDNYGSALKYWREYLKRSPDGRFTPEITESILKNKKFSLMPTDYSLLGDVFYARKEYGQAATYFLKAGNPNRYYELGYSLFRTRRGKEAIPYFKKYAKDNPSLKKARFALYYCSLSLPSRDRRSFWAKIRKEIPDLEYYAVYKEAATETSPRKKEKLLKDLIVKFPNTPFTIEAVWDLMWKELAKDNYKQAKSIGEKFFEQSRETDQKKTDTRLKVGFWLGKIAEKSNKKSEAIKFYEEVGNLTYDNYYSHRSRNRLLELKGNGMDPLWNQKSNYSSYTNLTWSIPTITNFSTLKKNFGSTVAELISLQQFDEAIDLIDKKESTSKETKTWLLALNKDYWNSISSSNELIAESFYLKTSPIYKLSYPLYYWKYVIENCKKYPRLDPFLACGVIRQESRFDKDAISVSDAHGLMQLIPPTARNVAKRIGISLPSMKPLHEPKINIALGTNYLNGLVNQFPSPMYAVASYNAGPGAIKRWISKSKDSDLDLFVEKIPYAQTRDYVKKVFAGYWTYNELYGSNS